MNNAQQLLKQIWDELFQTTISGKQYVAKPVTGHWATAEALSKLLDAAIADPLPPTNLQLFGFSESQGPGSPDTMSDPVMAQHFKDQKAAGASVVRLTCDSMNDLQFIHQFQLARNAGLKVLAVVAGSASEGAGAYANKAAWLAGIQGLYKIELGNEWNKHGFTPALAAAYHKAAYPKIKAVANIPVVSCGLAMWGQYSDGLPNALVFLEGMYAAGLKGSFDELGWHPYLWKQGMTAAEMLAHTGKDAPWSGWANMGWTNPSVRSIMTANGDQAKKITVTEWGAPTNLVGKSEQAVLMTNGIAEWKTLPWAADLLVYEYMDIGTSTVDPEQNFGLTTNAGQAKPALFAYTQAVG